MSDLIDRKAVMDLIVDGECYTVDELLAGVAALPATAAREAALREAAAMCDGEERSGGTGWECRDAILALIDEART